MYIEDVSPKRKKQRRNVDVTQYLYWYLKGEILPIGPRLQKTATDYGLVNISQCHFLNTLVLVCYNDYHISTQSSSILVRYTIPLMVEDEPQTNVVPYQKCVKDIGHYW